MIKMLELHKKCAPLAMKMGSLEGGERISFGSTATCGALRRGQNHNYLLQNI
jgi:hypothetical protein